MSSNTRKKVLVTSRVLLAAAFAGATMLAGCTKTDSGNDEEPPIDSPPPFVYNSDRSYHTELYRPQYHVSDATGNMSDPNGMVYFAGEYHQFYQNSGQWGHMVSTDLIHWTELQPALVRDALGEIWSGSAVVDRKDTSGFFGGKAGLVAIFTHFKDGVQSQSIAYSSDKGRTWTKYEGNPVIPNPGLKDFRDPKVIWYGPAKKWVMAVSVDQKVRFYSSKNLKEWTMTGEFGSDQGSHAAVWECPDLFELPVEGTEQKKWVLTVSIGNNETTKGSTAQYFVGSFDGENFTNDNAPSDVLWTDFGKDFYAAVSFSDIPEKDGRRIWVGWMSNWRYPFNMPTSPWKGNMSVSRELTLRDIPGKGIRLVQKPVKELETLRGKATELAEQELTTKTNPLSGIHGTSYELDTEFTVNSDSRFGLKLRKGTNQETVITYDPKAKQLIFDRTRSGESQFESGFAEAMTAPLELKNGKLKLQIFVDESTVEIFANDGEIVSSNLVFPGAVSNGLELFSEGGGVVLNKAAYYPLRTIWRDEDPDSKAPLRVLLEQTSLDIPVGSIQSIKGAVVPLSLPQQLNWVSSDESIAKVEQSKGTEARIKGLKSGSVEIKGVTSDGTVSAVLNVFVYQE
ncbi:GH32 C-terminal domain-containing protein [Paenibacillus caui]|uniref:GH32 C-terminal domain-containing protein n=1 Tax=Paenibacillus caui TaxID=2873927 RepID=UPI001CA87167|nr:GH32 C-terminal domain-containing protein [Paenibacillus caui]